MLKKISLATGLASIVFTVFFFLIKTSVVETYPPPAVLSKNEPVAVEAQNQIASTSMRKIETETSVIFVGDVMLSRTVAKKIKEKKNSNYPFLKMKEYLKSADIVFGNLENPITAGPEVPSGSMIFHANPGIEQALKAVNFSVLSLANNHSPNYGDKGLKDTFALLEKAGIKFVGSGKDETEANKPVFIESKGIKFAFLAYNDSDVVPKSYRASAKKPGTAFMDAEKMARTVKEAKKQSDFVIVSMHSGKEYTENLTPSQTSFAHTAIDAGADLVIGHHPHVVQRIEKYKDKYIFYSLGNFVFDQMWSEDTKRGVAIKISFNKQGVIKIEMTAVKIEDYSQPQILKGKAAEKVFTRLRVDQKDTRIILNK